MSNLENIFEKRLKQLGLKKQVDAAMIVEEAQKKLNSIFGEETEKNLKVISFNKGVLKIATRTSAWASECQGVIQKIQRNSIKYVIYTSDFKND